MSRRHPSPVSQAPVEPSADALHRRAVALRESRMAHVPTPPAAEPPSPDAPDRESLTLSVAGMTCRACEVRIARSVGRLPNVERVNASTMRGQVVVETSGPVSRMAIEQAINAAGYELGSSPWLAADPAVWLTAGAGVLLVAALAVVATVTGIGDIAARTGDLGKGGILVAGMLGLAAGVSTCMALVGGLVLGLSAAFAARSTVDATSVTRMRPALVFVGGRVVGYALFGAVLGAIGASVAMPPQLTAALMIAVALVMLVLGARLSEVSPRIAGWSPTLPMGLGRRLGLAAADGTASAYSDRRAAALGAASFFLPCGFTQAVQIYALSTGSPLFAAALLGTFAIGTAPGLLAVGGLPVLVPVRARPTLLRLVGVVVVGFALLNGSAGLRLTGLSLPQLGGDAAPGASATLGADGVQSITTYQDAAGYSPGNVVIYAGYPTRWTVKSSTTSTCAASIWAPDVDVRVRLSLGANEIDLPALHAGTLHYTCSMGMYSGRITVVDGTPPPSSETTTPG